ncbi:hypothetical protein [Candidatus Vallotia lariciata]|uniref:hypothetical protein n=1 Tax=Candidatus Vallotia laricis TaxID=2018052 RepID=UPI001D02D3E3|nr:hypothetical protein [Candidatus Vallotia lariciata]
MITMQGPLNDNDKVPLLRFSDLLLAELVSLLVEENCYWWGKYSSRLLDSDGIKAKILLNMRVSAIANFHNLTNAVLILKLAYQYQLTVFFDKICDKIIICDGAYIRRGSAFYHIYPLPSFMESDLIHVSVNRSSHLSSVR